MLDTHYTTQENVVKPHNPVPLPRSKAKAPPKPRPRSEITGSSKTQNPVLSERNKKNNDAALINDEETSRVNNIIDKTKIDSGPGILVESNKKNDRSAFINDENTSHVSDIIGKTKIENEYVVNETIKEELGEIIQSERNEVANEELENPNTITVDLQPKKKIDEIQEVISKVKSDTEKSNANEEINSDKEKYQKQFGKTRRIYKDPSTL
ncbi:hypothetical protein NQ314_018086 [Rhamnusium bicolor]|uniref:Uncharacterized protein n=1 Tax=Rhamnusium bicolor TaxID=1586634 RepID=A0AAV8WS44_9CUCU|nr:hypothetical protein NQ314_018086 [Rhamnusium bicolor]